MRHFRNVLKYIIHFYTARNTSGFSVHSPFVFQFTRFVLCEKNSYYIFQQIEDIRSKLKKENRILDIKDFGTGLDRIDTVSNIAKRSLKSAKYGQLLFRVANYFKVRNVLELGTSLGVTTAYLSTSSTEIKCISLEGCPQIAAVATENLQKFGLENVEIIVGNIDKTLDKVLAQTDKLDLIFLDANHRYESVLNYFDSCLNYIHNDSVMVIDDIYWSKDMENAWTVIKNHPQVMSTIDLFQLGIVFFNTDLYKNHYKMRY